MTMPLRSQRRIALMSGLIAEMGQRDITVQQAADHLRMTHAGGKTYMRDLRLAELITICGRTQGTVGQRAPIYRLTTDQVAIEKYMADLRAVKVPVRPAAPRGSLLAQALSDPTRHLHLLTDDIHYQPVMHRFTAHRDGLVAALFGPAGAVA